MGSPILEERSSKLSRLLHSRSASNMFDIVNSSLNTTRANSPSSSYLSSQYHIGASSESGRWSIKSLKREWKARTHARSLSHFPDGRVLDKTNGEHDNAVTYLPSRNGHISRFRSKSSSGALLGRVPDHQEWPERISSRKGWSHPLRTSVSSKTLSRIICSEDTTPETQSSVRIDASRSRSSTRVTTEVAGGCYDYQATVQVKQPASDSGLDDRNGTSARKVPTQSRPSNPHRRPTLSRGASKNSLTISIENHGQRTGQLNLAYSGISTSSQSGDSGILPQQTLAPPKDPLLPDSPGFPTMLAAMTFPSPPTTTSRPPSSDRSIGSTTPYQASITDPPTVRPRTSSKRACTSNGVLTASLNELLMQPTRPIHKLPGPNDASHLGSASEKCLTSSTDGKSVAIATGMENASLVTDDLKSRPSSGASSTKAGTGCDSVTSATTDNANSQRLSQLSDITAMTSSRQGSPTTAGSGTCTADVNESTSSPNRVTHRFCSSLPTISPTLAQSYYKKDLNLTNLTLRGCNQSLGGRAVSDMPIANFASRDVNGRTSIVERRMARRAKVQAYKRRDLDAAKSALRTAALEPMALESTGSPILGRFTDKAAHPRKLSPRELSHASIDHVVPSLPREDLALSRLGQIASNASSLEILGTTPATSVLGNDCTLSPIMTIEIVPEYSSDLLPGQAINEIAISPIMVVADLKSQPGSQMLSISSVHSPATTYTPSRPALKHRLKIIPQTRPRPVSVMMHRNPTTGDIERTVSSTSKTNRHSFMSMPSLPPSPSSPSIRRRSHPPVPFSWTPSPTVWDPTEPLEQLVANNSDQEEEEEEEYRETKFRVTSMKERLQRAKLAKEEEISQLVEKSFNASKPGGSIRGEIEKSQGEQIEQQIDGRIQRLEENGDAWLRVVKGLLENMSRTLHDIREENSTGGLTMNEFTVNLDAEARRISCNPPTPIVTSPTTPGFGNEVGAVKTSS
ncbi:hypothetical protein F4781DRAFT_414622 [Annulohypoxylon bovei var. microspora]|nr:hypothetical protein F4781DRAFT_414622 [Annulohypoxylon bovei var. microspora]